MPKVTFTGPFYERRRRDSPTSWVRGQVVGVTQAWLDEWRHTLPAKHFKIEEDEEVTVDGDNDGIPDNGWSRKDILKWLTDNGVSKGSGYLTKTAALALVKGHLKTTNE